MDLKLHLITVPFRTKNLELITLCIEQSVSTIKKIVSGSLFLQTKLTIVRSGRICLKKPTLAISATTFTIKQAFSMKILKYVFKILFILH